MVSDLPKDNDKLDELWLQATCPSALDFQGRKLKVTMLTGSFPNLSWAGHKKVFYIKDGIIRGYNVTFRFIKWGHFLLRVQVNETDLRAEDKETDRIDTFIIIDYTVSANSKITQKIVDHVRWLEASNLYLGKFHYGYPAEFAKFVGYFALSE